MWFLASGKANMGGDGPDHKNYYLMEIPLLVILPSMANSCWRIPASAFFKSSLWKSTQTGSMRGVWQPAKCDLTQTHTLTLACSQATSPFSSSLHPAGLLYCLATSLFWVSRCQHRLVETLEWLGVCSCMCVCPCVINCEASPRLWPSHCCAQLETLLGIVFYGRQGLSLLSVCSSQMCASVSVT